MSEMLLDQYLAEGEAEVLSRAQWAADTHDFYGLRPEAAVIFGSRALDMCGIDARPAIDEGGKRTSHIDLDVVAPPSEVDRFKLEYPNLYDDADLGFFDNQESLYNHHLIKASRQIDVLGRFYRADKYKVDFEIARATAEPIVVPDRPGTYMVQVPEIAAEWKLSAGGVKDVLAVMYAHASAYRKGHDIIGSPTWQSLVSQAISKGEALHPSHKPDWLVELQTDPQGVNRHPAFASLAN